MQKKGVNNLPYLLPPLHPSIASQPRLYGFASAPGWQFAELEPFCEQGIVSPFSAPEEMVSGSATGMAVAPNARERIVIAESFMFCFRVRGSKRSLVDRNELWYKSDLERGRLYNRFDCEPKTGLIESDLLNLNGASYKRKPSVICYLCNYKLI